MASWKGKFKLSSRYFRTELLIGKAALDKLKNSRVAIFGLGGVGSYVVEALARSGVGNMDIFDGDVVDVTNINRQLIALESTIGIPKVDISEKRINDINPHINVKKHNCFFTKENQSDIDFSKYNYVVDAIDMVSSKLLLIKICKDENIPIISSMGTGNKLNPTLLKVKDVYSTSNCPLARVMRRELRKMGIKSLKVVCSEEIPSYIPKPDEMNPGKKVNSSISFVPSVAGLIIASEVVKDLINK